MKKSIRRPGKRISVCMHAMNRSWQVKQTLSHNIESCKAHHELILVNYGSTDDLDGWVRENFTKAIRAGHLVYFHTRDPERFHASKSKNLAHRLATGDILVNCDGDNFFCPSDLEAILLKFREDENIVVQQFTGTHGDGTFGRLALRREHFQLLGGYDEGLFPLGAEDDDLLLRAELLGLRPVRINPPERLPVANPGELKTASGHTGEWTEMQRANVAVMEKRQKIMGYRRENQFPSFRGILNLKKKISIDTHFGSLGETPAELPESARHPAARPAEFNRSYIAFRSAQEDRVLPSLLGAMHKHWGNSHAADPALLWACCQQARSARIGILECGSGLSTLVLENSARVPVVSLEHDAERLRDMRYLKNRFALQNLDLVHAPLRSYGEHDWYDFSPAADTHFDLVLCDGPPAGNRGGRYGLLPALSEHLTEQAVILLDDMQREGDEDLVKRWSLLRPLQGKISPGAGGKPFEQYQFKKSGKTTGKPDYITNISVLMPAWNAAPFLQQTLDSCLAQTHLDFEFLICDDGSTDATWEILQACCDPRIRLLRNERNEGNPFTRNRLLDAAGGRYIAWADADDIYHPGRLARQLEYMETHPDCAAVSACMNKLVGGRIRKRPKGGQINEHAILRLAMLFNSPLNNPLAFMRAEALNGLRYPTNWRGGIDYWLWWQLVRRGGRLTLLPDVLCDYRIHDGQVSRREQSSVSDLLREVRAGIFADLFGRPLADDEIATHLDLIDPGVRVDVHDRARIQSVINWVSHLTRLLPPGDDREIFWQLAKNALDKKGLRVERSKVK